MDDTNRGSRNELLQVKVSAEEKTAIKQAAIKDGERQFTTWARAVLNRKVQQILWDHP